jgi:DNA adenine methylase
MQLVPMLAPHDRYFEVFAGGLSMFFRKTKADFNVVNDIDNDIVNLYTCVITQLDKLIDTLYWLPKSRTMFNDFKTAVKESKEINIPDVDRAAKYFYCIRNGFNKIPTGTFSKSSNWDTTEIIENLKYSRTFFDKTTIENLDFRKLIVDYKPREGDMFYLDPPYIIATERGDYYMAEFKQDEHEDLLECADLINRSGGKFMISYDDRPVIRDIYADYNIYEIETQYAGRMESDGKTFIELVITNYESEPPQMEMFI